MPIDPNTQISIAEKLNEKYGLSVQDRLKTEPELEWWQKPLAAVGQAPVIGDVLKGVGAVTEPIFKVIDYPWEEWALPVLTAPFTPATPGTEGKNWLEREREEYKSWESPPFVKGALELANPIYYPALLLGGAGLGARAAGLAGTAAKLGKAAKVAGAAEALPFKLAGKGIKAGVKPVGVGMKSLESALEKATGTSFAIPERALPTVRKTVLTDAGEEIVETPLTGLQKTIGLFKKARIERPKVKKLIAAERAEIANRADAYYQRLKLPVSQGGEGLSHTEAKAKANAWFSSQLEVIPETGEKGFKSTLTKMELTPEEAEAFKITAQEKDDILQYLGDFEFKEKGWYFNNDEAVRGFNKLMINQPPTTREMKLLTEALGRDWTSAATRAYKAGKLESVLDVANMPRAIISSWDFSAPFRQGMILTSRLATKGQFGEIGKGFKDMFKSFALEKNAVIADDIIKNGKYFKERMANGGYHAPLEGTLNKAEETFASSTARIVPGVRRSERAYVTYLNSIRDSYYNNTREMWDELLAKGEITEITKQDIEGLNKLVNWATGRGSIGAIEKGNIGPLLNATLFSPRLLMSRLQWPTMLASKSPLVRKEAQRQMAAFLGLGAGILGLAAAAGAKVNMDPRSSEFGKIRVGDTRLDIWTGYAQYARFAAQVLGNQRLNQLGEVSEADRLNTIWRFAQSKASPATGLLVDLLQGESYMGEEMNLEADNISKQAWNRLIPLFVQDFVEAVNNQGPMGGLVATPGAFGVGVITYSNEDLLARQKLTEEYDLSSDVWNTREVNIAKSILEPYYGITDGYWEQYPQLEAINNQINLLEKTDPRTANRLKNTPEYHRILEIRAMIARDKKRMLARNPNIRRALSVVNR